MNEQIIPTDNWDKEKVEEKAKNAKAGVNNINFFTKVMLCDQRYADIRFNKMLNAAEIHHRDANGKITVTRWNDTDEAESRAYIETTYGVYNKDKHADALRILFREREYDPVVDIIKAQKWDGVERCEHFLTKWAKAKDDAYTREVSRLIFAEGIARLILPGSKCDDVAILMGPQGCGKSSLIKFLAINDDYAGEVKTMDGDKSAVEQLSGKFILEIAELAALTRSKDIESVKAFVTRQRDSYRKPYDRNVTELPRRCIFIGSTNTYQFLSDKSGARRWYPVKCHSNGYEIHDHEEEIRNYILQCWAEAYAKHLQGKMPHFARKDLVEEYRKAQADAMEDDWRDGAVEEYLANKPVGSFTYAREIFKNAIMQDSESTKEPTLKESKDIGAIVNRNPHWERAKCYTEKDGQQRGWKKISGEDEPDWMAGVDEAESVELPEITPPEEEPIQEEIKIEENIVKGEEATSHNPWEEPF